MTGEREQNKAVGKAPARDKIRASGKVARAPTEIERKEWRDLCRRVRMYEDSFGFRYSRD